MNEEYLKMCQEAWDNLEKHMPNKTDDLWCDGHSVFIRTPVIVNGKLWQGEFVDHIVYKLSESFECEEFVIWRQEDLQEIVFKKYLNRRFIGQIITLNNLLNDFLSIKNPKSNYKDVSDFNQLWLCFVMETCYNKQWDGERWRAIE